MDLNLHKSNILGGIISLLTLVLCILIFVFRLNGMYRVERWLGVMFFFAGTGGLIGIASQAGKNWTYAAIVLFFLMTALAFWQRAKTGM
jgi:hypothetical protein